MEKKIFRLAFICSTIYLLSAFIVSLATFYFKYLLKNDRYIYIGKYISTFQLTTIIDVSLIFSFTLCLSLSLNENQPQYIKKGLITNCILYSFCYLILDYFYTYFIINTLDKYIVNNLYDTNDFIKYLLRTFQFFSHTIVLFFLMVISFKYFFSYKKIKFTHLYIENEIVRKINSLSYSLLTSAILLNYMSVSIYSNLANLIYIIDNFLYESTLLLVLFYLFFFVSIIILNFITLNSLPIKLTQFYSKKILYSAFLSSFIIITINDPLITILLPRLYFYSLEPLPTVFISASIFYLIIFWFILLLPFFSCSFSIRYFFAKL